MLECALDQLHQRLRQHFQVGDRREEGEGRDDGLGYLASHDRLGEHSRRQLPQPAAGAAELRDDRRLRQRLQVGERSQTELAQPAMRVGIERQHGEGLSGEKRLPLPPGGR